jgi:hypothetical protein
MHSIAVSAEKWEDGFGMDVSNQFSVSSFQ